MSDIRKQGLVIEAKIGIYYVLYTTWHLSIAVPGFVEFLFQDINSNMLMTLYCHYD